MLDVAIQGQKHSLSLLGPMIKAITFFTLYFLKYFFGGQEPLLRYEIVDIGPKGRE